MFLISAYSSTTFIKKYREYLAQNIIEKLAKYKSENGNYPQTIDDIDTDKNIKGLTYNRHGENYSMEYYQDGINKIYYDSELKEWKSLD